LYSQNYYQYKVNKIAPFKFLLLGVIAMIMGCSAEKTNVFSTTYHNTTARFNPYFMANEYLKEVETSIEQQHKDNYNKTLKVYPYFDTTSISGVKTQLDDCLKKSSKAIDWHKNSSMMNPSYILLGRALFYQGEYEKSITAFKIVNKNIKKQKEESKRDANIRHEALAHLIRTYTDYGEENNAIAVGDFLRKETLSKDNQKKFYLNKAYLYQKRKNLDSMVRNLVSVAPLLKRKEGKAKTYFIIGQVYQKLGFDAEAYDNYTKCIKSNPPYELDFYAKLNRAQVFELSKTNDLKKIRKFYKKLLRDAKNKEFKDKIYYDMAEFEMKQGNLEDAIAKYKQSVAASVSNNRQKGFSYLRLGQVYYEQKKDYELAKSYYDSTVAVLPKDEENYLAIEERQKILADFVTQINTIQLQDSLLTLSTMDTLALTTYLDGVVKKEQELAEKERIAAKKAKRKKGSGGTGRFSEPDKENKVFASIASDEESSVDSWYFYNTTATGQGQSEFVRRWGRRQLEDNWRRSNKETANVATTGDEPTIKGEEGSGEGEGEPKDVEAAANARKLELLGTIPFSEEAKTDANKLLEDAHYNLGKIYHFNLKEEPNAYHTFDTLLVRYDTTQYKPEVLYLMYLISKDLEKQNTESIKSQLLNDFPNTIYARVIKNPNYDAESKVASEKLQVLYKDAYAKYKNGQYSAANQLIKAGKQQHGINDFSDNLRLLEILVLGKTSDVFTYKHALTEFPKQFPESELLEYASSLLETMETFGAEKEAKNKKKYIKHFEQVHTFVLAYNFDTYGEKELPKKIDEFIKNQFEKDDLKTANMILTEKKSLIIIEQFKDKKSAMVFLTKFNGENSPLKDFNSLDFSNFVITKDNFDIFYKTKDIDNYLSFFKENYINDNQKEN